MKKFTIEEAEKGYEKVFKLSDEDNELAHIEEDSLKNMFIFSIANSLYEKEELLKISKIMDKITDIDYTRWHA